MKTLSIAPPNSILVIEDPENSEIPDDFPNDGRLAHTATSILLGVKHFAEGPTGISLLEEGDGTPQTDSFEYTRLPLDCPSGSVVLSTVLMEELLRVSVPTRHVWVDIWRNHRDEPDLVWLRFSDNV